MKRSKILYLGILLIIFLTGCYTKNTSYFDKKMECANYYNQLLEWNQQYIYSFNDENGEVNGSSDLGEIFYSPRLDTCIITRDGKLSYYDESGNQVIESYKSIENALTYENIRSANISNPYRSYEDITKEFKEKVQELKMGK